MANTKHQEKSIYSYRVSFSSSSPSAVGFVEISFRPFSFFLIRCVGCCHFYFTFTTRFQFAWKNFEMCASTQCEWTFFLIVSFPSSFDDGVDSMRRRKSGTKLKHMEVAIFFFFQTSWMLMCCSSTVCDEWVLHESGTEKEQISKNSFVCTLNVNGKKFNSFCLFHRIFFLFRFFSSVSVHSLCRVYFHGKCICLKMEAQSSRVWECRRAKRMKWVVVNEMEVCTSYLANGHVWFALPSCSIHVTIHGMNWNILLPK